MLMVSESLMPAQIKETIRANSSRVTPLAHWAQFLWEIYELLLWGDNGAENRPKEKELETKGKIMGQMMMIL